jgi:hypothetical protein
MSGIALLLSRYSSHTIAELAINAVREPSLFLTAKIIAYAPRGAV